MVRVVPSKKDPPDPADTSKPAVQAIFEISTGGPKFVAKNPGSWANDYTIVIDHTVDKDQDDPDPTKKHLFNLKLKDGNGATVEEFRNISRNEENKRFALNVLKEESDFIQVREADGGKKALTDALPLQISHMKLAVATTGITLLLTTSSDRSSPKKGIYSLDSADIFNLLCIPAPDPEGAKADDAHYSTVYTAAVTYCKEKKRAILLVDPPNDWKTPQVAPDNIDNLSLSRNENAAIYYPLIRSPDPQEDGRYRTFAPCGVVTGVIAKTDAQRGIWKAPARHRRNTDRRTRIQVSDDRRGKRHTQPTRHKLSKGDAQCRKSCLGRTYAEGSRQAGKPVEVPTHKANSTLY